MNRHHMELLVSDEWRQTLENMAFPFAFGESGPDLLGDDPLEIGPGPGLTTDLLRARLARLTSIELDPELAAALRDRLAGTNVTVVEGDATEMPFEDGRFSGAATFTMLHHVPTVELQDRMFAEVRRVLRPGGVLVANDSVGRAELAAFHEDDTYNPVDTSTLEGRLVAAGFVDVRVSANEHAWACQARCPA
jgi:SAM-dependent methyltransferase